MFNFNEFENVTNKQIQLADVKVFAANKIRIGEDAYSKLGLTEDKTLVISRNKQGDVAIYATEQEGIGRKLNAKKEFSHQTISHILGGQHSEWTLEGEGVVNPATGDKWFALEQTTSGEDVKKELAEVANETEEDVTGITDLEVTKEVIVD